MSPIGMRAVSAVRRSAAGLLAGAMIFALAAADGRAQDERSMTPGRHPIAISFTPLPSFRLQHPEETRFGQLRWLGGGVLSSANSHLGGLSGLAGFDGGRRLLTISDNGLWFGMNLKLDADGAPVGVGEAWVAPMRDAEGRPMIKKSEADSEGLALRPRAGGLDYLVSFEGEPRILVFREPAAPADRRQLPLPREAGARLAFNGGLEALATTQVGPLAGMVVAIGEGDRERGDRLPGWILRPDGGSTAFSLLARNNYAATDAAFLPDGDLLLLERRFNLAQGVGMRIRRFPAARLAGADGLDGEVLIEADLGYQIDNMEGLAVDVDDRGRVLLTIVSDDNRSILQRTLLLRFELVGGAATATPENAAPRPKPAHD